MIDGVNLPKRGSPQEMAFLVAKERNNTIEQLKFHALTKAIFAATSTDNEATTKEINSYNKIIGLLLDEIDPARLDERKKFEKSKATDVKKLENLSFSDLIGKDKTVKIGEKVKKNLDLKLTKKNWSKIN